MSGMSGNPHTAVAKFRQEGVHEWQSDWGSTDATNLATAIDAQVEATLALAYEQRTANLIALQQLGIAAGYGPSVAIAGELDERMGLA